MKILALIPARGGSKRLKNKNVLILGGKPLINWSIDLALQIKNVSDVLVSTDSDKIAKIARDSGAMSPWLRPKYLSSDRSTSVDTAIHALNWYESNVSNVDGLLLLQPTSPFRTKSSIESAIQMYKASKQKSIVGVKKSIDDLDKTYLFDKNKKTPISNFLSLPANSKHSKEIYTVNGNLYLVSPSKLRHELTFVTSDALPFVLNSIESIDIDTEDDFNLAQLICNDKYKLD